MQSIHIVKRALNDLMKNIALLAMCNLNFKKHSTQIE